MSERSAADPSRSTPAAGLEELAPGAMVGEYVLKSLLARGGHGAVYAAEHRLIRRVAAVKVLHRRYASSSEMVSRFVREARVVNQIRHRAIVDIYDLGMLPDGRPYCVMELLEGQDLSALLHQRGRLTPAEALAILEPVCAALQAAHEAGVVHRDVKASNVLVGSGEPARVTLLDFGIAKVIDPAEEGLTAVGERLGSTHAMAPEQICAQPVDGRTDVYALGVLLHQILTGRVPFQSDDPLELERLHLEAPPPRPSAAAPVPPAVDAVVACALEKSPQRRFPSAAAFAAALRRALEGSEVAGEHDGPALAIHVAAAAEGLDEAQALAAQAAALDGAAAALRAAGLSVPLQTGDTVLAVLPLPAEGEEGAGRRARAAALAAARALPARMRAVAGPSLRVRISAHAGTARLRNGPRGPEVAGGPLLRTAEWVADGPEGFHATAEAMEGIEG